MYTKSTGFTLIEMVVVIVLIGILSAVAVPRFMDFTGDAQKAVVEGTAGALSSGLSLTQTKWLISNQDPLNVSGRSLNMSPNGFPNGVIGIGGAEGDVISPDACAEIAKTLLDDRSVNFGSSSSVVGSDPRALKKNFNYVAVPYTQVRQHVED